jgi:NADH:ubiquinone oxidoreductase subunit K
MKRGQKTLLIVILTTALVMTPLILGGVYLGYYVADAVGYSRSVMAIVFSTAGFAVGMAIIFRVIKAVAVWGDGVTG